MENITKGDIMKKVILLIALSVLLYSAPGHTGSGPSRSDEKAEATRIEAVRAAREAAREAAEARIQAAVAPVAAELPATPEMVAEARKLAATERQQEQKH